MENDWQAKDIECVTTGASFSDRTDISQRKRRPFAIFMIALFQICRGIFIAGVMLSSFLIPDADITSRIEVKVATFILARQNLTSPVLVITLPLAAASKEVGKECVNAYNGRNCFAVVQKISIRLCSWKNHT
jgi:hypothetical protein